LIDDVMKYYVIIYQSLVKTSNGLNEKLSKNGLARNVLILICVQISSIIIK